VAGPPPDSLCSHHDLVSPVVWTHEFTAPVCYQRANIVTNLTSGGQKFYRLIQ